MTIVLGIDPGLTGAVAAIDTATSKATVHDLPTTALEGNGLIKRRIHGRELALLLRHLIPADGVALVYLEQVGAMGGKNNAVQTQASLAGTFLSIRCVLDILRLTPVLVQPQTWKKHYGLKREKDEKDAQWKRRSLEMARTLYPGADMPLARHQNRAEAVLIGHFGVAQL